MKGILLFLIAIFLFNDCEAQLIRYVFQEPVKLNSSINSEAEESQPVVSSDGSLLYFVRTFSPENTGGTRGGQDIWFVKGENGMFNGAPEPFKVLNNISNNAVVGVSSDDSTIYLLNIYKNNGKSSPGISYVRYKNGTLSEPEPMKIPGFYPESDFYGFWMNPEGDTLLISMEGADSKGKEDLYVCFRDGKGQWSKPLNLGSVINSAGYEISPFLDADGKRLFFASNGKGGWGDADIFMSVRQDDSWTNWSYPLNLGKPLNSKGFDAYLYLYKNKAYFSSNREGGLADLYMCDFQRLKPGEKVKKEPPSPVTIYFKFNDYMLYDEQKKELDRVVQIMKKDRDLKAVVSGYTCDIGDNQTNEKLSALRAESVLTYFVINGIYESRIEVKHYGESQAQQFNRTEQDRALDRRVDIRFYYPE